MRWNGSVVGRRNAPTSSIANGIFDLASVAAYRNASAWPAFVALFSPSSVSGMTLWLDATTGLFDATTGGSAVTADASAVARWEDQSGNGRHVTQSTVNDRPQLKTSVLNGLNILRFDGSSDRFLGPALSQVTTSSAYSVFVVGKAASVGSNSISGYANDGFWGQNNDSYQSLFLRNTNLVGAYNWDGTNDIITTAYTIGDNALFYSELSSSRIRLRLNGGSERSASTGNTSSMVLSLTIGMITSAGWCLDGDIAEMIFYNSALSATDREKVEGYLAHKWGLTAELPAEHPHKTTAP